jgi:hypothetical protein
MFMFTLIVIHNHQSYKIKLSYMVQHIKLPPSMSYMEAKAFIMCSNSYDPPYKLAKCCGLVVCKCEHIFTLWCDDLGPFLPQKTSLYLLQPPLFWLPSCENLPQKKKTLVWKYKGFVLGKNGLNLSHHLTLKKKMKLGSGSLPHMNRFEPKLWFLKF